MARVPLMFRAVKCMGGLSIEASVNGGVWIAGLNGLTESMTQMQLAYLRKKGCQIKDTEDFKFKESE